MIGRITEGDAKQFLLEEERRMKHDDKKETFETGAQRDTDEGKGRPSLISPVLIHRLGVHLAKGALHYGADNWVQGMPYRRTADSMIRHIFQWLAGDESEDHLAAIVFGAMCLMHYEAMFKGFLPGTASLDDRNEKLKRILSSILTSAPPEPTLEHEPDELQNSDDRGLPVYSTCKGSCGSLTSNSTGYCFTCGLAAFEAEQKESYGPQ